MCGRFFNVLQARKRALVVLTDTMSPSATKPVPLELSYLKDTLMMDSLEEVQELCIAHGLETGMDGTTPIVLLVKVIYIFFLCLVSCKYLCVTFPTI